MDLSILYFNGSQFNIFNLNIIVLLKIVYILANSADPDEMPHEQHFIWVFTVCQTTYLSVSRMKRVKTLECLEV